MPETPNPDYEGAAETLNAKRLREQKKIHDAKIDLRTERVKRVALCGVTAVATWKFANARATRQATKTAYVLGRQAGAREAELGQVIQAHVEFLDRYHLLPLFKKVMGYPVDIDPE